MDGRKHIIRSTNAQIKALAKYMSRNRAFANGEYYAGGPSGVRQTQRHWEELKAILKELGPDKSIDQWKQSWRDLKRKVRRTHEDVASDALIAKDYHLLILDVIDQENSTGFDPLHSSNIQDSHPELVEKVKRQVQKRGTPPVKIFKQSCIDLVKVHNRPLELFNDNAFRKIVDLLHFEDDEIKKFSSEQVKAWMESEGHDENSDDAGDGEEMEVEALEASDSDIDTNFLKSEVPTCSCSNKDDNGDVKHAVDCPLARNQPYWGYFEVSPDDATCTICHKKLHWNNLSELKTHLQTTHPSVKYKDDDDAFFEESTVSQKRQSLEELYFEEDTLRSEPDITPTAKKRRISYNPREIPKRFESVRLIDKTDIPIDKFKILDRFGLYVAGLLANLTPEKCKKFQLQIVERLLREQPAAG